MDLNVTHSQIGIPSRCPVDVTLYPFHLVREVKLGRTCKKVVFSFLIQHNRDAFINRGCKSHGETIEMT